MKTKTVGLSLVCLISFIIVGNCQCDELCQPSTGETDCCEYADTDIYDYCNNELGDITAFENCDSTSSINSTETNNTNSVFNCNLDWDVDFVGKSGQFKLYPCSDTNFFIKVKLQTIQEYDIDNKKINSNKVTSFSYASSLYGEGTSGNSSVYSWKDADNNDVTLGGVTLTYYFYVSDALVKFYLNLYLIDQVTIIEYKDDNNNTYTQELSSGNLKFDYKIENWPFEEDENSLQIELRLTTGGTTNDPDSDGESNGGSSSFSWGDDFEVILPEIYSSTDENDTETSKNVTVEFDVNPSGKQVDITYIFENAGDSKIILYDPFIRSLLSKSDDDNENSVIYLFINLNLFVTIFSLLFYVHY